MNEFLKRVTDYFDPDQLIDFLDITIEEVVSIFEDKVIENQTELEEFMNHGK